jgi:type I restriction enzyme, S subunit
VSVAVRKLGHVCEITMGQAPDGASYNEEGHGLPLVAGAGDFGAEHPKPVKFTTAPTKRCKAGDIILGIRATIGNKVLSDGEYCLGRGVAGLRVGQNLNDRYLWHWLTKSSQELAAKGRGATFLQVSRADIEELAIPLPTLDEQRRIAAILDKADALRRKRKRAIELLDSLTQSIFLEMFVPPYSEIWPEHTIDSLAINIRTGPFGSQLLHSEFVNEGIAVLGIDNAVANEFRWSGRRYISKQKYETLRRYTVLPSDLLITIMGTCGRCAIVPDNIPIAINTKHLCCISLNEQKCLVEFLHAAFLQHPHIHRQLGVQAKGAVMPGLNMGIIKSLLISLPPLNLQRAFARQVSGVRKELEKLKAAKHNADALFSSLQHRAFTGQL